MQNTNNHNIDSAEFERIMNLESDDLAKAASHMATARSLTAYEAIAAV